MRFIEGVTSCDLVNELAAQLWHSPTGGLREGVSSETWVAGVGLPEMSGNVLGGRMPINRMTNSDREQVYCS